MKIYRKTVYCIACEPKHSIAKHWRGHLHYKNIALNDLEESAEKDIEIAAGFCDRHQSIEPVWIINRHGFLDDHRILGKLRIEIKCLFAELSDESCYGNFISWMRYESNSVDEIMAKMGY